MRERTNNERTDKQMYMNETKKRRCAYHVTHCDQRVHDTSQIYLPVSCNTDLPCHAPIHNSYWIIGIPHHYTTKSALESTVRYTHMWHVTWKLYQRGVIDSTQFNT